MDKTNLMNDPNEVAERYIGLWDGAWEHATSPDLDGFLAQVGPLNAAGLSRLARIDQAERWRRGDRRMAEEYLVRYPAIEEDHDSAIDLIYHEYLLREKLAEHPKVEEYTSRFPTYAATISDQVSLHLSLQEDSNPRRENCTQLERTLLPKLPAKFGRYRVLKLLGRGGMGTVYLAEDPELGRQVALKLPRFDRDGAPGVFDRFRREARIAATFHHPNLCPVYDFGELEGSPYLTMPFMVGQPLSARLQEGPISEEDARQIALKVATAMTVAHRSGIVHRDLKPSNILLRDDGQPVVMDFGLARRGLDLDPKLSGSGTLMGTLAYMAPEQIRATNHEFDEVGDVYGLGVILYEMLAHRRPFEGSWQEVLEQVQFHAPAAPSQYVPDLSPGLDQICLQALAKDPRDRFRSMEAFAEALIHLEEWTTKPASVSEKLSTWLRRVPRWHWTSSAGHGKRSLMSPSPRSRIVVVGIAVIISAAGWFGWRSIGLRWARRQIPVIEELAAENQFVEAYQLAVRVWAHLPKDARLTRLMPVISDTLSIKTQPAGARVYLKRFDGSRKANALERVLVGETPLLDVEMARASYVVSVEKEGYVTFQRTVSGATMKGLEGLFPSTQLDLILTPIAGAPPGMVFVPGGDYRLVAWRRPTDEKVKLDGYFIDRTEVSNRQYQEFVAAGGYLDQGFWTQPFVVNGRRLTHDEAMRELTDKSGQPGPRGWSKQTFPSGQADHPVTGISWYEAMAYAAYRGKNLPTIFQWEKAARNGESSPLGLTMPWGLLDESTSGRGSIDLRANFASKGTVPVGSHEFGMSPFGCYEMAGNVAEWCLNETSQGFITSGSSWEANPYEFGYYGTYPAFDRSDQRGFRCVMNTSNSTADQGAMRINLKTQVPRYTPRPEAEVRSWFARYEYNETAPPQADVVEVDTTNQWRREKIQYDIAGVDRVLAYLYLPGNQFPGPHQLIHLIPAGDVWYQFRSLPESIEADYDGFLRSGRAIFAVVPKGTIGRDRPKSWVSPSADRVEFADEAARQIVELRRGLDYLETRPEVDTSRIVFLQASAGGHWLVQPAIETRYQAVVLWGAGIRQPSTGVHAEASSINFAPLIGAPKLFIHGLQDETTPLRTDAEPLYELLSEPKRLRLYQGGHRPDPEYLEQEVNEFLDEYLGPVTAKRRKTHQASS